MSKTVSEQARDFAVDLGGLLLFFAVLAVAAHLLLAAIAYVWSPDWLASFKASISGNIPFTVGIPCAAVGAFAVVALLLHAFPPATQDGAVTFKAFGLEFSGPAGPTTLWLACFLSFIASIYWLTR